MLARRLQNVPLLLAVSAIVLFVLLALAILLTPMPAIDVQEGETHIVFSASKGLIIFPNDCLTVQWAVQNTLGVTFNNELLPTPNQKEVCLDGKTPPTLTVILPDNREVTYTLAVVILVNAPVFWVVFMSASLLAISAILITVTRRTGATLTTLWQMPLARQAIRGVLWVVVSGAIAWAVLDVGLRAYFSTYGTEPQKIMYIYSVEDIRAKTSNLIHVPYVSYLPNPAYEGHNNLGYRGEDITVAKPEGVFRIVALGGSTTYSTGTTADDSYPALLQKILREDYGYDHVQVINAGFIGYTSWEALTTFEFRALALDPDMVIYYEGVNDLAVRERASTDCYAGENPMRGLNPERGIFVERTPAYPASTLYRLLAVNLGWIPNPLALDSAFEPPLIECLPDNGDVTLEKRLEQNQPTYFERNIRNLVLLAQANGVQPIISSWVYNTQANRPQLWRDQIALQNEVLRQLADTTQTPFYDLASQFPTDNAFWQADGIHMVTAGTTEQAQQYAKWLDASGLLKK